MTDINDMAIRRRKTIDRISQRNERTLFLPELTHIRDLVTDIRLEVAADGPHMATDSVYLWAGEYREHNGTRLWVAPYVELSPCLRTAIEAGCSEGKLGSIQLIEWHGEDDGLALLIGGDRNHIAQPWVTIVEYRPSKDWIDAQIDQLFNNWVESQGN